MRSLEFESEILNYHNPAGAEGGRWTGLYRFMGGWLSRASGTVRLWVRHSRQRATLRELLARDDRFFTDVGLSRGTVFHESSKWFWQA